MDPTVIDVNWQALLAVLISAAAPTITGFLQQFSIKFQEKAPWWAKSLVTAAIGALLTTITSYIAQVESSIAAGAIVATIGSINIALRKGSRGHLEAMRQAKAEEAIQKFLSTKEHQGPPA